MCPTYQISIMLRFKRHGRKIQDDQKKNGFQSVPALGTFSRDKVLEIFLFAFL